MFSQKRKNTKLAIAVRDDSIIAVERGKASQKKTALKAWSIKSLNPGIIQSGKLIKPRAFEEVLLNVLKTPDHGDFTSKSCHLVLSEALAKHHVALVKTKNEAFSDDIFHEALMRVIHKMPGQERMMHGQMDFHEDKWIHASYSFAKNDLQQFQESLEQVGLSIADYSTSAQAASAFYFIGGKPAEPLLWIHLGEGQSEFVLMDTHGIYQSDAIPFGTIELEKKLGKELSFSTEQVQALLRYWGGKKHDHEYDAVLQASVQEWVKEILFHARPLRQLSKQHHQNNLAMLLCGKGSLIPGVAELVQKDLDLPLRVMRSHKEYDPLPSLQLYHQFVMALGALHI